MGGAVKAIEAGFIQNEIADSAYKYQKGIESGGKVIVGQNKFTVAEPPFDKIFSVNDSIRSVQMERIKALKQSRNNEAVVKALSALDAAAREGSNMMPHILTAVEGHATLGEIADTLRKVFGEHR
jgi:methylmalonyl-CoA mutase N-terminal domain/subunit